MPDAIPTVVSTLSAPGILGILVVMLLTGRGIATRREVDAEKARADLWQEAWKTAMATNAEHAQQISELLENSRASARVLTSIQEQSTKIEQRSQEWGSS